MRRDTHQRTEKIIKQKRVSLLAAIKRADTILEQVELTHTIAERQG
jgi:hypothetical protein